MQTRLILEPIPESLTDETPTPVLKKPVTWGGIGIWADQLHDALDTCNADKSDIRALNILRLARQKGVKPHAEN
ncbi:Rz1-like lysis system protein LysC [Citrobacter braakii]|uniref:Rz1-like lysis system protein LysC n=1 Tax=Citrobacter braakii TaxID=57706 RepID=UPI0034E467B3